MEYMQALDIGEGLQYLHMRSVVHRDLKSPNILLNDQNAAKISDFNLSRIIDGSMNHSSVAAMNPRWLAPELFDGEKPSITCDVFSFGVILWELITLEVPWGNQNPWIIVGKVKSGERLKAVHDPNLCSAQSFEKYSNLMTECWKQEKHQRIPLKSALDILSSLHKSGN
jgi:sterile alpha motif and leucine zipper-containing kinase AZK